MSVKKEHKWQVVRDDENSIVPSIFETVQRMRTKNGYIYRSILFHKDGIETGDDYPGMIHMSIVYVPD